MQYYFNYYEVHVLISYIKSYFRGIKKSKIFTLSTIFSLSIGVSIGLISFLWIQQQTSYDTFHKRAENIYRVILEPDAVNTSRSSVLQIDLAERLKEQFAEVEKATPVFYARNISLSKDEAGSNFVAVCTLPTDNSFFSVFDVEFMSGNKEECLNGPDQVVITESLANILFPNENAIGKTLYGALTAPKNKNLTWLKVSCVIKDFPKNSIFANDKLFINYKHLYEENVASLRNELNYGSKLIPLRAASAFICLNKNGNKQKFINSLSNFIKINTYGSESQLERKKYSLQKLTDIHLYSDDIKDNAFGSNESIKYVYVIAGVGGLFLFGAFLNYFGYSLIFYNKRIKELGINKFLGAKESDFVVKFLIESMITLSMASVISVFLAETAFVNIFNKIFINKDSFVYPFQAPIKTIMFYLSVLLLAGIPVTYYTYFTCKIKTVNMIYSKTTNLDVRKYLWRGLIIAQMAISVFLIASGIIINNQVSFLKNFNPGYSKNNVYCFDCYVTGFNPQTFLRDVSDRARFMKSELHNFSGVECVTRSNWAIGFNNPDMSNSININGNRLSYNVAEIDSSYFNIYNIKFIKKTDLSNISPQAFNYIAITEQTAKDWGVDYINNKLPIQLDNYQIAAIVNNIHQGSFKGKKSGVVFNFTTDEMNIGSSLVVKIKDGREMDVKEYFDKKWKELTGEEKFMPKFTTRLDNDDFSIEESLLTMISIFSIITLFMALISIFSSVSYNIERRTKELGIRKILGASVSSIFWLIIKEMIVLVLLSVFVAAPFVSMVLQGWLQDFCYRVNIGLGVFILTAFITSFIAFITICFTVAKASSVNPIDSLRYE
jgi:putative ABC transport system permease protein